MTDTLLKPIDQDSQSEPCEVSEILSWEEIVEKYPNQTVLIVDFETDKAFNIKKGRVIAHANQRDDIYKKLVLIQDKSAAIEYTGDLSQP